MSESQRQTKPRVLVTSAAGRTAAPAVRALLDKGFPVRAFVRRDDARAEVLRKAGAEILVGNIFDLRDLRKALVDVQRAYYCPPLSPNLLHGAMLFALAAEEAKLEAVALMSQWNPHPTHPSAVTREHWMANNVYRWMPSVGVIHINPGLFAFLYLLSLPMIVRLGILPGPYGDGRNAPPSNEDIERVAAGVLADPTPHIGKSYRPTGPELLSPQDIAEILTGVVGRSVKYTGCFTRDVPQGRDGPGGVPLRSREHPSVRAGPSWWYVCHRCAHDSCRGHHRHAARVIRDDCSEVHRSARSDRPRAARRNHTRRVRVHDQDDVDAHA